MAPGGTRSTTSARCWKRSVADLSDKISARLFISPDQVELAEANFALLPEGKVILDAREEGADSCERALAAILTGRG
jgi:hypothetical protein